MPFNLNNQWATGQSVAASDMNNIANAINALVNGPAKGYAAAGETTTSTTYTDLPTTTDQVTVTIGQSGIALVFLTVFDGHTSTVNGQCYCSFAASGANTIAAGPPNEVYAQTSTGSGGTNTNTLSGTFLVTGLAPGATTFKMKYKAGNSATAAFYGRAIVVVPFP
jgi:hypothetical protein